MENYKQEVLELQEAQEGYVDIEGFTFLVTVGKGITVTISIDWVTGVIRD